jgi:hypothetical protein
MLSNTGGLQAGERNMRTILIILFLVSLVPVVLCVDLARWMSSRFSSMLYLIPRRTLSDNKANLEGLASTGEPSNKSVRRRALEEEAG